MYAVAGLVECFPYRCGTKYMWGRRVGGHQGVGGMARGPDGRRLLVLRGHRGASLAGASLPLPTLSLVKLVLRYTPGPCVDPPSCLRSCLPCSGNRWRSRASVRR